MYLRETGHKPIICGNCRKPPGAGGWRIFKCAVCNTYVFICPREGCFHGTPDDVMELHYRKHRHGKFVGTPQAIVEPAATCSNCGRDLSDAYHQCNLCEYVIYRCGPPCDSSTLQQLVEEHRRTHGLEPIVMGGSRRHLLDEVGIPYVVSGTAILAPAWIEWVLLHIDYEHWRPALRAAALAENPCAAARAVQVLAETKGRVARRRKDGTTVSTPLPIPVTRDPAFRHFYDGRPDWARSGIASCEERFEASDRALDEVVIELPHEPLNWYFHMRVGDGEAPEWAPSEIEDEELPEIDLSRTLPDQRFKHIQQKVERRRLIAERSRHVG